MEKLSQVLVYYIFCFGVGCHKIVLCFLDSRLVLQKGFTDAKGIEYDCKVGYAKLEAFKREFSVLFTQQLQKCFNQ